MDSWRFERCLRKLKLQFGRDIKPQVVRKSYAQSPAELRRAKDLRNQIRKKKAEKRRDYKKRNGGYYGH